MTDEERIESIICDLRCDFISFSNLHDDGEQGCRLILEALVNRQQSYDKGCIDGYNKCDLDWQRKLSEQDETIQPFDAKDEKCISEIGLSVRTYNALRRAGIDTVHELMLILENDDIYKIRGIGKRCVLELMEKVSKL